MSSKRKSPPTKLSEGGGGAGTVAGEEEEDTTSSLAGAGGEIPEEVTSVDIEDCYPLPRPDCESSGCSSPGTTSEPELRDSPSPSPNSPPASKRQRLLFLANHENLSYHNHHHHHHTNTSSSSGGILEPASSSECGSPPTLLNDTYYPHHQSHHHHNNNNTVTQNNNNNNNGTGPTAAGSKRSMDDVLKRLTCKMNSGSLCLQDEANIRRTPPPSSTPTSHHSYRSVYLFFCLNYIDICCKIDVYSKRSFFMGITAGGPLAGWVKKSSFIEIEMIPRRKVEFWCFKHSTI